MNRLASERGVTLIEVTLMLIVSVVVLGTLAPTLAATLRDVRRTRAITDMERIRDAINNFKADGFTQFTSVDGELMELLVSDGDIPNAGLSTNWRQGTAQSDKDFLEQHLVLNSFGGTGTYGAAWRGAYINAPIDPDPWGNRYAVNVSEMGVSTDDVVVFSAGPDEEVDTSDTGNPLNAADDDIVVLVEA